MPVYLQLLLHQFLYSFCSSGWYATVHKLILFWNDNLGFKKHEENNLVFLCQAFERESKLVLALLWKSRWWRLILTNGMHASKLHVLIGWHAQAFCFSKKTRMNFLKMFVDYKIIGILKLFTLSQNPSSWKYSIKQIIFLLSNYLCHRYLSHLMGVGLQNL